MDPSHLQQTHQQYQTYDPSQPQSYDPYNYYSSSYYQYQSNPHHSSSPYYAHTYGSANAYHRPELPIHPPGVPEVAGHDSGGDQSLAVAAAAVALAQLTQFAGSGNEAEKPGQWLPRGGGRGFAPVVGGPGLGLVQDPYLVPGSSQYGSGAPLMQVGQPPYGRGVRRGGGGQGHMSRNGSRAASRGRGRGRGRGGRRNPIHGASSYQPRPPVSVRSQAAEHNAVSAPDSHGNKPTVDKPQKVTEPARCELCKVDCTSLEILEQHKIGKRHMKNLKKMKELGTANRPVTQIQNERSSVANSSAEETSTPNSSLAVEEIKQPAEAVTKEMDSEQQNDQTKQPELPTAEAKTSAKTNKAGINRFANQNRGMKRKMRGGLGGKRLKFSDVPRQPSKPKVVIPLICDLCNVRCDTQEVFDRHLAGKKHISKLKRFQDHQAMYGPVGLQALYPPNPMSQTQVHSQGPQQAMDGSYAPSASQQGNPGAHEAAPAGLGLQALYPPNSSEQILLHSQGPQQASHEPYHPPDSQQVNPGNNQDTPA